MNTRVIETALTVYLTEQLRLAGRLPYDRLGGIKKALVDARTRQRCRKATSILS